LKLIYDEARPEVVLFLVLLKTKQGLPWQINKAPGTAGCKYTEKNIHRKRTIVTLIDYRLVDFMMSNKLIIFKVLN